MDMLLAASVWRGQPVEAPATAPRLVCVYCKQPFPPFTGFAADGNPHPCACGAPFRSALFGADEHGVPYPPASEGWPR